jgi:dihydroorotase
MSTRREFSRTLLGGAAAFVASTGSSAAAECTISQEEQGKFNLGDQHPFVAGKDCDLLIKGGTVIDPGQHLHDALDVAVKNGKILELSKDIPESRARKLISAKGKIVTPGFIELHVHCYDQQGFTYGRNADHYGLCRGVTTCVDGGSTGYATISEFVKYVIPASTTRIYSLVHMGAMGGNVDMPHRYGRNLDWVIPEMTARAAEENKPAVVGFKVHFEKIAYPSRESELALLKMTQEVSDTTRLPFMVHAESANYATPELVTRMRQGDIYTHCFNNYAPSTIFDENGKIHPAIRDARARGVFFEASDGHKNCSFDFVDKALDQDFLPDALSSDFNQGIEYDFMYDLPTTVSKYLALGMKLDKAIELVTFKPSQIFGYGIQIGTLRPGSEADISVFDLYEGDFEFVDGKGGKRMGHQMLVNKFVVCRGQLFSNRTANYPGEKPWRL